MKNRTRYYVVDAFTDRPFTGNPAAVVPLDRWPENWWLQSVALEMNLSETAFCVPNAADGYDLRWFTPKKEVDLCGHATLAAAFVLSETGSLPDGSTASFSTRSGVLQATRRSSRFYLDFPALAGQAASAPAGLLEALGISAIYVAQSNTDYLVQVESENVVRGARPDFARLAEVDCRGVVITARSTDPAFDFVSRFFAPALGLNEDPVTGSAHCLLAPHWAGLLRKSQMTGYQASARGGIVHVELRGERVILSGHAVLFSSGEIFRTT